MYASLIAEPIYLPTVLLICLEVLTTIFFMNALILKHSIIYLTNS